LVPSRMKCPTSPSLADVSSRPLNSIKEKEENPRLSN
jgi:hypothetical protein